jgi:rubredoxin
VSKCACGWVYPKAVGAISEADAAKYEGKTDTPVADRDLVKGLTFVLVCPRCKQGVLFLGGAQLHGAFAS